MATGAANAGSTGDANDEDAASALPDPSTAPPPSDSGSSGRPPGPYWPGTVTWVESEGQPRRTRLLLDRSREDLRAAVERTALSRRRAK